MAEKIELELQLKQNLSDLGKKVDSTPGLSPADVAKAKNPIDMGKAFVDFALTSVNKFLKSIFK